MHNGILDDFTLKCFDEKIMEELILRVKNYIFCKGYDKKEYPYLSIFGAEILDFVAISLKDMDMNYVTANYVNEYLIGSCIVLEISSLLQKSQLYVYMEKVNDKYRFSHIALAK